MACAPARAATTAALNHSDLGFWWLAVNGKGVLPGATLSAFDWDFVKLAAPTPVDDGLLKGAAFENISGGMGTAAMVAFMRACATAVLRPRSTRC